MMPRKVEVYCLNGNTMSDRVDAYWYKLNNYHLTDGICGTVEEVYCLNGDTMSGIM